MRITEKRLAEIANTDDPVIHELLADIKLANEGITIALNIAERNMDENDRIQKIVKDMRVVLRDYKDKIRDHEESHHNRFG